MRDSITIPNMDLQILHDSLQMKPYHVIEFDTTCRILETSTLGQSCKVDQCFFGLTTDGSHSILILSVMAACSLHSLIRILVILLILLSFFNFFNLFHFLGFLDSHCSDSLFLPFLEASSGLGENGSGRGRLNVAKLPKLLPVNLPRRLTLSSNTVEIKEHTLSLTLFFSMHRYPITRRSVWLGVSPTDFTGSEVFPCCFECDMIVDCDVR